VFEAKLKLKEEIIIFAESHCRESALLKRIEGNGIFGGLIDLFPVISRVFMD
jgi:hypothetical protein